MNTVSMLSHRGNLSLCNLDYLCEGTNIILLIHRKSYLQQQQHTLSNASWKLQYWLFLMSEYFLCHNDLQMFCSLWHLHNYLIEVLRMTDGIISFISQFFPFPFMSDKALQVHEMYKNLHCKIDNFSESKFYPYRALT